MRTPHKKIPGASWWLRQGMASNPPATDTRPLQSRADKAAAPRLEYLRGELRAGKISMGELVELQSLACHIHPGDVELLEAAGVPEFPGGGQ